MDEGRGKPEVKVDLIGLTDPVKSPFFGQDETWHTKVWKACRGRCSGCGSRDRLKVYLVVPEEAGGRKTVSNSVLLCRPCEIAKEIARRSPTPASGSETRPINFWVSRRLHQGLSNGIRKDHGFRSIAALVRFLMMKYVQDAGRYDDLEQWQDEGADVKVNVWISREMYQTFKAITDSKGVTVTDTLKGLIKMYEAIDGRVSS